MKLSKYVRAIIGDPSFATRDRLTIDHHLIGDLTRLRKLSEAEIREWGAMLYWSSHLEQIQLAGTIRGKRTYVDWDPGGFVAPTCVGTVHTHPYEKKLGRGTAVGFSIGDFVFYGENVPEHYPCAVHLVLSSKMVFVAVYRDRTRRAIGDTEKHNLETDETEAETHALTFLGPQGRRLHDEAIMNAQIADQEGRIDESGAIERDFFAAIPGYVEVRVGANRRMIRRAANQLGAELYWGALEGTLERLSFPVYSAPPKPKKKSKGIHLF